MMNQLNNGRQSPEPLTELAERYTHPTGPNHSTIAYTGKSGLTPITPYPTNLPFRDREEREYNIQLEAYQLWRFCGFRTQQLDEMEALAPTYRSRFTTAEKLKQGRGVNFKGLGSSVPIHPLYTRDKWETRFRASRPRFLLPGGKSGYWEVANNRVWQILVPCLRLTSAFLSTAHVLTWFEAFLAGDYESIEDNIPPEWKGGKLLKFKPHLPRPKNLDQIIQRELDNLVGNVVFDITSGWLNAYTGKYYSSFASGVTGFHHRACHVEMAFENMLPLLGEDHTTPERQVDVFRIAITLLHETCHAIWMAMIAPKFGKIIFTDHEPYFDGQPLTELGYSMEDAVLGGYGVELIVIVKESNFVTGTGLSSAGMLQTEWFRAVSNDYPRGNTNTPPAIPPFPAGWDTYNDYFPVPIGYFEDMSRLNFWTYVRKYGTDATKMGPKIEGRRVAWDAARTMSVSPYSDLLPSHLDWRSISTDMTLEEVTAAMVANSRLGRTARIKSSLDLALQQCREAQVAMDASDPSASSILHSLSNWLNNSPPSDGSRYEESVNSICPRYSEIKQYLLANRSQGRLCLDTMLFDIPENTLLAYILLLGGLDITPEEWRDFLKVCEDKGELFRWKLEGHGVVRWVQPRDPLVPILPNPIGGPLPPNPVTIATFQQVCLINDWILRFLPDFDFADFVHEINRVLIEEFVPRGYDPTRMLDVPTLHSLIDYHDARMHLWCWGPNRVVRRLVANWPA